MRIVHTAFFYAFNGGKVDQLRWEKNAAVAVNRTWKVVVYCVSTNSFDKSFMVPIVSCRSELCAHFKFALRLFKLRNRADILVVRYDPTNVFLPLASFFIKPFVSEHHAIERNELRISKRKFLRLRVLLEQIGGKVVLRQATGIVAVTNEILKYQKTRPRQIKPSYVLPNGVDSYDVALADDTRRGPIKVAIIATRFAPWQGVEKILDCFLSSSEPNIELHIFGNTTTQTRAVIDKATRDSRIVYKGFVNRERFPMMLSSIDVAASVFNGTAVGLNEGSRLKVRHLLAMGIPVISGETDSAFPIDFPYYRVIGTPSIKEFRNYGENMRAKNRASIRTAALPFIEKREIARLFNEWLHSLDV